MTFLSDQPLFSLSFPETRANLTHFYVMRFGGQELAIGEAEFVRHLGRQRWEAHIVKWDLNAAGELDPTTVAEVAWRIVQGPTFVLIPKESYRILTPTS